MPGLTDDMYNSNDFTYEADELVECIIINEDYPASYKKSIDDFNAENIKAAEAIGVEPELKPYSFKEGGLSYTVAICKKNITRVDGEILYDRAIDIVNGVVELPEFIYTAIINFFPPHVHLNLKSKKGTLYGDMYKMGGTLSVVKGKPVIAEIVPSVNPCVDKEHVYYTDNYGNKKSVPWDKRVRADNIPIGEEEKYKQLISEEKSRKHRWEVLIEKYYQASEEECKTWLQAKISQRYLLCHPNDKGKYEYVLPEVGMLFNAGIAENTKTFPNIRAIGDLVPGKGYKLYSNFNVHSPSEDDVAEAELIYAAFLSDIEKKRRDREVSQKKVDYAPEQTNIEADDEEPW